MQRKRIKQEGNLRKRKDRGEDTKEGKEGEEGDNKSGQGEGKIEARKKREGRRKS